MSARDLAVQEAREAGFAAELYEGKIPFIPVSDLPTMERKREAIRWVGRAQHVGGARIFAEGMVLHPPPPPKKPTGFPWDEPEVMQRYGIEYP